MMPISRNYSPPSLRVIVPFWIILGVGIYTSTLHAKTGLRYNPFLSPTSTESAPISSGASGENPPLEAEEAPKWELRATLVAGSNSFANIDGRILKIGEEVEGYRLVSIEEGKVKLSKDGKTKTLAMTREQPEGEQK